MKKTRKPLLPYCVTYEFNGRSYWERVKSRNPATIPARFKTVKVTNVELELEDKVTWKFKKVGAEVTHRACYRAWDCTVTNWPGSRTLWWAVECGTFRRSGEADRFEHGVKSLKEKCIEVVDELVDKTLKNEN